MQYKTEWAGGACHYDADTEAEAIERARDLVEDMGNEAVVLAQEGDGWRVVCMVAAERLVAEERRRLEELGL